MDEKCETMSLYVTDSPCENSKPQAINKQIFSGAC